MRKITLFFAALLCSVGVMKADFVQPYNSSASLWHEWNETTPEELQGIITTHNCDGTIHYGSNDIAVSAEGDITVTFQYSSGLHKMVILGVEFLNADGTVAYSDYHEGATGGSNNNNTYTLKSVAAGDYTARYFTCSKEGDHAMTQTNGKITFVGNITEKTVEAEPISTEYYYQLKNVAYSTMLTSDGEYATVTSTNDITDNNQLWAFEAGETENTYKLKNLAYGNYLNNKAANNQAWTVSATETEFVVDVKVAGTRNNPAKYYVKAATETDDINCMHDANWGSGYGYPQIVRWYSDADASQWILVKTNISTSIEPVNITYVFTCNGKAIEGLTQESSVFVGDAYPNITVSLPYGISAVKPEGVVEAAGTHTIELTVEKELPFETFETADDITTWYYVRMHANTEYTKYIRDNWNGGLAWADAEVDEYEKEAFLFGFVGDAFGLKVVTYDYTAITSTSGDATIGNLDNATAFVVTGSQNNAEGAFCLKYPDANSWLNAQNGKVTSYGDNDNGSTLFVIPNIEIALDAEWRDCVTLGETFQLTATVTPASADQTVAWESSNPALVSVDENGLVTILAAGMEIVYITATASNGATATCELYVMIEAEVEEGGTVPVESIMLNTTFAEVSGVKGTTFQFTATVMPEKATDKTVTWSSNMPEIATVDENGLVTLVGEPCELELINITATASNGISNKAYLYVTIEEGESIETGIQNVEAKAETVIYDLLGRRVEKAEKGIYIINGKKVVIK